MFEQTIYLIWVAEVSGNELSWTSFRRGALTAGLWGLSDTVQSAELQVFTPLAYFTSWSHEFPQGQPCHSQWENLYHVTNTGYTPAKQKDMQTQWWQALPAMNAGLVRQPYQEETNVFLSVNGKTLDWCVPRRVNPLCCWYLVMLSRPSLSDNEFMMIFYKKIHRLSVFSPLGSCLIDLPSITEGTRFCSGMEDKRILSCPLNVHVKL